RTEPPSRRTGRRSLRLALEQCAGASDWQRRRAGQGCPVAGDDSRLAGVSQQRAAGSGTTGHSASFAYWPAFGRRGVPVSPGGHARPRAAAQEAGSEIEQSPQLSHVSPELPTAISASEPILPNALIAVNRTFLFLSLVNSIRMG